MFYFYRYWFNPANIVTMKTNVKDNVIEILLTTGKTVEIVCSDYEQVQKREKEFLAKFKEAK